MQTIRLAVVQPVTAFGPDARSENLATADRYVAQAAAANAHLVLFPESFPGAWQAPVTWTPVAELSEMARTHGIYVIGGFAQPPDDESERGWETPPLFWPAGGGGRYRRTTPRVTPWLYKGGRYWNFDWVHADDLPVFATDLGCIGMVMCSEVYATECSRAMAIQGADLTVLPAGLPGPHMALYDTWQTLIWARAIENLMYTATCGNILPADVDSRMHDAGGLAMVCSPEAVLLNTVAEGMHCVDLDLERLQFLRESVDRLPLPGESDVPWKTKPGVMRDWRRDAVLHANPVLLSGT